MKNKGNMKDKDNKNRRNDWRINQQDHLVLSVMSEGLYLRVEHTSPKVTITSGKINTFFKPRLTNPTLATVNIYHFLRLVLENLVYTTGSVCLYNFKGKIISDSLVIQDTSSIFFFPFPNKCSEVQKLKSPQLQVTNDCQSFPMSFQLKNDI